MTFTPAAFPKIPAYCREADPIHYARNVVCLEKIDGTNTRIGVPRGARRPEDLVFGGRSLLESEPSFSQPMLRAAFVADQKRVEALLRIAGALPGDLTLYGETCGQGIQATGFIYGPSVHFVLFAATVGGAWLGWSHPLDLGSGGGDGAVPRRLPALRELAERVGLPLAPCLYQGAPDPERFDALIDRPSKHAASRGTASGHDIPHEGIVIWSDPVLLDGAGRLLAAKHKHPRRRETRGDAPRERESPEAFAARVIVEERVRHARQHLEESGRWHGTIHERVTAIVRRVVQDVAEEEPSYAQQIALHGKADVRAALEWAARPLASIEAAR